MRSSNPSYRLGPSIGLAKSPQRSTGSDSEVWILHVLVEGKDRTTQTVMTQTYKVLVHTARGERHDPIGGQVVKVRLEIPDLHHDYVGRPRVQLYPLKLLQGRVLIAPSSHDDAKPPDSQHCRTQAARIVNEATHLGTQVDRARLASIDMSP